MIIKGATLRNLTVYDQQFVSNGLQLYYNPSVSYPGSGTSLNDLSNNGFNGTLTNSPTFNATGNYFTYNGSNTYILTPSMTSAFIGSTAVSIEMWLYPTAAGCAMLENGNTIPGTGWTDNNIEMGNSVLPRVGFWNGAVAAVTAGTTTTGLNNWYQIVLTYNGSTLQGYNNAVAGTGGATGRQVPWLYGNQYYLIIGAASNTNLGISNAFWSGRIGIVRVYNRGLTAQEVDINFQTTRSIYKI